MDYTQARILEWVAFPFSRGPSNTGIKPRSPTLQADSLPVEPQEKPKNTGVGSLPLLQQIFPTQESNWSPLHCRWIPYQLSYQRSPYMCVILLHINYFFHVFLLVRICPANFHSPEIQKSQMFKRLTPPHQRSKLYLPMTYVWAAYSSCFLKV